MCPMPYALLHSRIEHLTQEEVSRWRVIFKRMELVLLVGGWPCGGESASALQLLDVMLRIRQWIQEAPSRAGERPWTVIELYENVMINDELTKHVDVRIGCHPMHIKCEEFGWCCRSRKIWMQGLDVIKAEDLTLKTVADCESGLTHTRVHVPCQKPILSHFLNKGSERYTSSSWPWPCFVRPQKRDDHSHHGDFPNSPSQKALNRLKADAYRRPPAMYEDEWMVTDRGGPRRLKAIEQARMLGFGSGHFERWKPTPAEDEMGQFVSSAFPVLMIARLLVGLAVPCNACRGKNLFNVLWDAWISHEKRVLQHRVHPWSERFGPQAGDFAEANSFRDLLGLRPNIPKGTLADSAQKLTNEEFLILNYLRIVSLRGSDVRFDTGVPYSPRELARRPIDPSSWIWKVFLSYKWKQSGHINVLEAVAVLDLLRKLARSPSEARLRRLLLVDNQSVLGVLARGRSSSQALQAPLTRIAALLGWPWRTS